MIFLPANEFPDNDCIQFSIRTRTQAPKEKQEEKWKKPLRINKSELNKLQMSFPLMLLSFERTNRNRKKNEQKHWEKEKKKLELITGASSFVFFYNIICLFEFFLSFFLLRLFVVILISILSFQCCPVTGAQFALRLNQCIAHIASNCKSLSIFTILANIAHGYNINNLHHGK